MIKSFSIPLFLTLGVALGGMTSCDDEEVQDSTHEQTIEKPVILKGKVYKLGDKEGETWRNAEEVGVYMVDATTGNPIGDFQNVKYIADNRSTNGYLVPANNVPLYLPKDNTPVKIIAYYPFSEQVGTRAESDQLFHLDLGEEDTDAESFLYANDGTSISGENNKTEIGLKSALTKVEVSINPGNGLTEKQLAEMSMRITSMPSVADFDILNGKFNYISSSTLPMKRSQNTKLSCVTFPVEITDDMQVEAVLPGEDNIPIVLNMPLKDVSASLDDNTQYNVSIKVSPDGMKGELVSKSSLIIFDWQDDTDIHENMKPESQEIIRHGNFETLTTDKIKVGASLPKESGVWYGLANKVEGKFSLLKDEEQSNYLSMHFSGKLNWYSNYLGYMLPKMEKGHYQLMFNAKSDKKDSKLQVYARINKSGNHFFLLDNASENESAAAKTIVLNNVWTTYVIDFNLTQSVNTIYAKDKVLSATTESDLSNSFLAFSVLNENVNYSIDDVILIQVK